MRNVQRHSGRCSCSGLIAFAKAHQGLHLAWPELAKKDTELF